MTAKNQEGIKRRRRKRHKKKTNDKTQEIINITNMIKKNR